jgi:arylsulfatase A-like enzyme
MIDGWHHQDERWARKTPFVWGTGIRSTLDLPVFAARPLTLRFECRPFPRSGLRPDITVPDQGVTVVVNGWTIGAVKLEEGFRTYTLDIPANALVVGRNRVEFHYLYSPEGSSFLPSPSPDGVPRSVAWASVGFEPAWSIEAPSVGESADELRLPFNTGVDYFALAPAGAVLKLDGLDTWGDKPSAPRLEVHVSADDSSETVVTEHQPSMWRPPSAVPVHGETSPRLVRISFVARSGSDGGSPGGLTLQGPTLVAPTTHAPSLPDDVSVPDPVFPKPTNVLIYLIDTLRADHLGVYGYDLDTSPHLDAFAKDSVVFTDARAQSSWTRSSVASIFTGLHPRSHNVNGRADKLSPRALTLSTLLSASGYQTTGIITNGNVSKSFGFEIGFDRYEYLRELRTREIHVLSDAVNERATRWLDQRDPSRPFFLYLHTADPHDPYTPRSPFRERFVESPQFPDLVRLTALLERGVPAEDVQAVSHELRALYDAEIAFNDEQFGTLVQELKSRGLYDSTMIIVVSDHGEEFQDHGSWGHGKTLYEEQLAVPLIMKLPGQRHAGRTVGQPAQHVDLMPTILALLDLPIPPEVQGQSLWPAIATESTDRDTGSVAYLNLDGRAMESLQLGALKMIRFPPHETASQVEVFDLATDPAELANLAGERPVLRGYLLASLGRWVQRQPSLLSADEAVIDADLEERLRTLGYIR